MSTDKSKDKPKPKETKESTREPDKGFDAQKVQDQFNATVTPIVTAAIYSSFD